MKKNIAIAVAIVITFIIALVGCSCSVNTSNREKITTTSSEKTSNMNSEETTTKEVVDNSTSTTNPSIEETTTNVDETTSSNEVTSSSEVVEQETTTKVEETTTKDNSTTTKPTTTKPVQTTTKKPVQTTTKKPSQTTSSKPSKEETTTKAPSQNKWVPQYYTAGPEDDIGDGLDELRVGLQKYSSNGTQLYVMTNHTDKDNGFYAVSFYNSDGTKDKEAEAKYEAFRKAFEDKYDPPTNTGGFGNIGINIRNDTIDKTTYYIQFWNIWYPPSQTKSGNVVEIYVWDEARLINIYRDIMPEYITNAYKLDYGLDATMTLEEYIAYENVDLKQYLEGERLAKKYGIDFHQFIEFYQKEYDEYLSTLETTE